MHVLFLAKGTRGDVQPAAVLAHALRCRHPHLALHFVTHLSHKHWLEKVLHPTDISCSYLNTLPARVWDIQKPPEHLSRKRRHSSTDPQLANAFQSDSDLEESLAAVHKTLVALSDAIEQRMLIIFNLFALEALPLAEALGVSCLAISPCLVPYAPAASFSRRFAKTWPALYHALCNSPEGQVSWAEVEHWLWPAFSERWVTWRQERLNLAPAPFTTSTTTPKLGLAQPHDTPHPANPHGNSSTTGKGSAYNECHGNSPNSNAQTRPGPTPGRGKTGVGETGGARALPDSIPLLYGLSEHVIQRPGYWPNSVHCCGFWQQSGVNNAIDRRKQLHGFLPPMLHDSSLTAWQEGRPLVCIDFGSMGCMGLIPDPHHLVRVLVAALQRADAKGILLTGGWKPLLLAAATATEGQPHPTLIAATEPIPHHLLLPECRAAVHHGGAGTSAAVLAAGLPHVVCPFHFDQYSWAERLTYLGVALQGDTKPVVGATLPSAQAAAQHTQPPSQEASTLPQADLPADALPAALSCNAEAVVAAAADALGSQLRAVLGGRLQQQCRELQERLGKEDGVSAAVDIISRYLAKAAVPSQDALLRLAKPSKPTADVPAVRQATARRAVDAAEASTEAADVPDAVSAAADAASIQECVQLPSGWSVPARSQVEARFIYREIVEEQCYLQGGIQIRAGDTVVDVGANIGLFSWWVMQGGPDRGVPAVVWAVEPVPANLTVLRTNLRQHGLTEKVRVVPAAIGAEEGQVVFRYFPAMPGNSTCHVQEKERLQRGRMPDHFFDDSQDCACRMTTVSRLMEQQGICQIDLLKVDVEGCELQVLQGIQEPHWPHIMQMVLEVHDTEGRLNHITHLLQTQQYLVSSVEGLGPDTYLVYARRV